MNIQDIDWDKVPETLSLEQVRKLIHVSKRVAKKLLDNEIPCIVKAKTTHKYIVDKEDLIEYLGTHSGTIYLFRNDNVRQCKSCMFPIIIPEYAKKIMTSSLEEEFAEYPDLLRIKDVTEMIGYSKEQIGEWANEGLIRFASISNVRYVSKSNLIGFLCTEVFDSVFRKSKWHKDWIERLRQELA